MNFGGGHPAHGWQDCALMRSQAAGHGKKSSRCVPVLPAVARLCPDAFPVLPAVARLCPDAFPGCRPWQDCALMRSRRGLGRENTGSRQHIACMYSDSANFGKICVLCVQKDPQSAVGECTARASCRQGALSPSEALRSCTAHESCHPPVALPLRRGSCPSNRIAGSPFNGLALAQGRLPRRPADTRHLPMPAARCARCSQRQAADGLRRRSSGAWPAVRPSPEGPTTTSSRRAGRQRNAAQNRRRRPQARPGLRQRCQKRPSKGRVPLGGTIGTPPPK